MKVSVTPTWVGVANCCISQTDSGEAIMRAAAEAHDGHAGGHAGPVGEPGDQRLDRRDIADAEAAAADHAIAEIDDPELVEIDAERGDEEAAAETQRGGEHGFARADPVEPGPGEGGGEAERTRWRWRRSSRAR